MEMDQQEKTMAPLISGDKAGPTITFKFKCFNPCMNSESNMCVQ